MQVQQEHWFLHYSTIELTKLKAILLWDMLISEIIVTFKLFLYLLDKSL